MEADGQLSVQLISDSSIIRQNVSVEVRNSKMRLVNRSRYDRQFGLPAGLYEVSAVLEDGRKHSRLVEIKGGENTPVTLGISEENQSLESQRQVNTREKSGYVRPHYIQKMETLSDAGAQQEIEVAIQLIDVEGGSLVRHVPNLWVFECTTELNSVPSATFQIGDKKSRISLPISSDDLFPRNSCVVKVEQNTTGVHIYAWISPERSVANALQNMLVTGYVLHAANVADEAVEMLRSKYSDPTGAALGALILQKVGRLSKWRSWVENLARDFDWLPDGKVLLAKLLIDDGLNEDRVLDLAIKASNQRMLYTESYSLLLDILRRWPFDTNDGLLNQAKDNLLSIASFVDWESVSFSNLLEED